MDGSRFDRLTRSLASGVSRRSAIKALLGIGGAAVQYFVEQGAKVACYLYNGVEYLETMTAAFKVAMAPVNTNYRYGPDEITYLFDNADAEAVVFHACFTELLDGIRANLPKVKRWIVAADDKKRARLNCIAHLLSQFDYGEVERPEISLPERLRRPDYTRRPVPAEMFVPERY